MGEVWSIATFPRISFHRNHENNVVYFISFCSILPKTKSLPSLKIFNLIALESRMALLGVGLSYSSALVSETPGGTRDALKNL